MTKRSKEMLRKNYQRSRPSGELSSTAKYQSLIAEPTQLEETRQTYLYLYASKQILMWQETSQKHKTDTSHPDSQGIKINAQVTPNLQK